MGQTALVRPDRPPRTARRRRALTALVAAALLAGACAADDGGTAAPTAPPSPDDPTTVPVPATTVGDAAPGDLLDAVALPAPAVAPAARAWSLAYVLTDVSGQPAAATGLLVVPPGDAPDGGWPLVVWGHPTRGTADACAPSREGPDAIPDLAALLAEGWAVAAPDLEGLGSPGHHPYLVAGSGAESLLRAAEAVPSVPDAGLEPSGPVALLGFSQGGHAAAAAAEQARERTPELDLRGVALAAPVADPAQFVERAEGRADQVGVAVTVVGAYAATYPDVDPADVLAPSVVDDLGVLEDRCIGEVVERFTGEPAELLVAPAADDPALAARLAENRPGDVAPPVPVLVVQGTEDDIVFPEVSEALVERWCAVGADVELVRRPGATHGVPLADVAVPWLAERFAGVPAPPGCSERDVPVPG